MYGYTKTDNSLVVIDPKSANNTPVAKVKVSGIGDNITLSYGRTPNQLLGFDFVTGDINIIDTTSAVATKSFTVPIYNNENGNMTYMKGTVNFIGINRGTEELYDVSSFTGMRSSTRKYGFHQVNDITFDSRDGMVYGLDFAFNTIFKLDTNTGLATAVRVLGSKPILACFNLIKIPQFTIYISLVYS